MTGLEDKGKSESKTLFYWIPAYFDPDGVLDPRLL